MDLVSNDKILKMTNDPQKEEGSDFVEKLDLNVVARKEEGNGTYSHGYAAWNDASHEMEMDLNQQEPRGSPMLLAGGSSQGAESLQMKPSSLSQSESLDTDCLHYAARKTDGPSSRIQSEFYQDYVENSNVGYALKRLPSPPEDNHSSGELEAAYSGDHKGKSSYPLQMESWHDDKKAEDTLLSVIANTKNEKVMETHVSHGAKSPYDVEMKKYSNDFLANPGLKMNSACESENHHHNSKDQSSRAESEKGNYQHPDKLTTGDGEIEIGNSDPNSPGKSYERSPVKLISVSPDISSSIQPSPENQLSSPVKGFQESFHSPGPFRERRSPLPQGHTMDDGARVDSHDCLSPAAKGESTSPWRAAKHSQQREHSPHNRLSVSPKRQHSPPGHQRQNRSASRSPIRRKVSPRGYGRDYCDRSRSRSPHARDRYSRPPRRRYSPSHRSPRGYPSRRSPRRRPWSPPPNRSTGVGRPGKNLFVAGFSFVTTERDLERKFSRFGRVTGVRIVRDKRTGDSRGFGFLSLERDEDADAAIRALDQTQWNGRIVLVEKSKTSAH